MMATSGQIYVLWAEYTTLFKIGFTTRPVGVRAKEIEEGSPFPLRVIGCRPGARALERDIHQQLRPFCTRGEWFSLPDAVVWRIIAWLGLELPLGAAGAADRGSQPVQVS